MDIKILQCRNLYKLRLHKQNRRHTHLQPQQYNGLGKDKRNSFESHEKVISVYHDKSEVYFEWRVAFQGRGIHR